MIEPSNVEDGNVEIDFPEAQLPFGEALVQVAQEHFAFFSAEEGAQEEPVGEPGSVGLSERVQHLEIMIQNLNATMASLVPTTPKVTFAEASPPAAAQKLPSPKTKPKGKVGKAVETEESKFPDLDPGVVNAALQAGVEPAALEEMQSLMTKNPKAVKALRQSRNAPLTTNDLSESEDGEEEGHGLQDGSGDPVASALTKLTKIVGQLSHDKKKRSGTSRLENALDGAMMGAPGGESSSSLGGKKSAVARRILRSTLQEAPEEIYGLIERLMAEDVVSQTLQPGLALPPFTARGWVEHRSKIGPYKAVAHASWGVAGILDQLRKGNTSGARARCCLMLLQLDQSCVDKGSWSLASDLSLELPPPFTSLSQHQAPAVHEGDLPYSKLLDARWAELTLAHLKDQDDYIARRKNLGKKVTGDQEDPIQNPKRISEVQGKGKGCSSSRRSMSPRKIACEQREDGYVPEEARHSPTMLPGERASTVVVAAAVNSLFRWVARTKGAFRNFLLSVVAKPEGEIRSPTSKRGGAQHLPLWPMPVPFPEVFTKKVNSGSDWQKIMICMEVPALSWMHLGEPASAPVEIRLGAALTPQQWSVVNMLRRLSFDSNTPEFVDASMMSRAAAKFESMEDVIGSLHRSLLSFEDGSYFGTSVEKPQEFDESWMRSGSLVGRLGGTQAHGAKPVVASRLEFPAAPSFDPVPFFDAVTAELFMHPLDHAMSPEEFRGEVPAVSVHGTHGEKVELYKKLADCNRLRPVPKELTRDPYVSGLFTVNKNTKLDRLILDARPPNLLEQSRSFWCGTMASCSGLGDILLDESEALVCSGLDLKDFFYQFLVSDQRVVRNTLAGSPSCRGLLHLWP